MLGAITNSLEGIEGGLHSTDVCACLLTSLNCLFYFGTITKS